MLGLQNAGTAGLVQMVDELVQGQLSNQTTTALIQAVSVFLFPFLPSLVIFPGPSTKA